jgi:hypothetical protein
MKKLLILLFSIFFLFLSGTNALAAQGVDCRNIEPPNLSEYALIKKTNYEEERLGKSLMYQRGQSDILTYYSYDNGYDFIDQEVLDSTLVGAFQDIVQRYDMTREENYELQDDAQYLYVENFNKLGMKKFVNQGVYMTSIEKNSSEPIKKMEVITVGTDGYCIHKFRWTAWIYPEMQPVSDNNILGYFVDLLHDFYKEFIKIN